jgi:hypothetical protein
MRPLSSHSNLLAPIIRGALLLAAVATYFVSRDDVVWSFIKAAPRSRLWEHVAFGTAAVALGAALFLKLKTGAPVPRQRSYETCQAKEVTAESLQAIGIGSLFPLPGFLLFVLGNLGISLFLHRPGSTSGDPSAERPRVSSWSRAVPEHPGLCCALVSMTAFSITLIDRVADAMFAATAIVSLTASVRHALRTSRAR